MQIGELARRSGVSRRSLRYYEQHGLLHSRRGGNGWREYDEAAVSRAALISGMLGEGLTIADLQRLAPCLDMPADSECADPDLAARTYRQRLSIMEGQLAGLRDRHELLSKRLRNGS